MDPNLGIDSGHNDSSKGSLQSPPEELVPDVRLGIRSLWKVYTSAEKHQARCYCELDCKHAQFISGAMERGQMPGRHTPVDQVDSALVDEK